MESAVEAMDAQLHTEIISIGLLTAANEALGELWTLQETINQFIQRSIRVDGLQKMKYMFWTGFLFLET